LLVPTAATGGSADGYPPAYAGGSDNYAFWSALTAATTVGIIVFSRAASFDMILTMTMTWALAFYVLHEVERDEKLRGRLLAGFYVFVGLSLLAKGLIGIVIPAGVIGLFCLLQRRLPDRRTILSLLWGAPLALIVAATWYWPVIARHGWPFIDQFFIQHHFARYVSDKYHHWRPFYYYLQVVPLLALPWTVFLVDGLRQFRSWLRRADVPARVPPADAPGDAPNNRFRKLMAFARAWFLFPFLFFSFSGSKLPGYILPILPAAALIVGERMWRLTSDSQQRRWPMKWQIATTASLGLLFAVGVLVYSRGTGTLPHSLSLMIAAPLLVAGVFPFVAPRRRSAAVILLAGATVAVLAVALYCVAPAFAELESSKRLLQLADARGYSQTPIYGLQRSDRTPEFYAAGRVVYGADGEPIMYEGPGGLVYEAGQRKETVLAFVPTEDIAKLTAMPTAEIVVIGDNERYALVAVRAK
jgi:4-amino-4-deoxy-L-arabinose transferase-like glycosyltransferase